MSNKRRHHDRKSIRKRRQQQRRLESKRYSIKIRKMAKQMIEETLSREGITGLRMIAKDLDIPFGRVYGEPYRTDGRPTNPAEVTTLRKRVFHRFIQLNQRD